MTERWIVVPNWREFQHYKNRDPSWVKAYTRLLDDPEYLELSFHVRGVLLGLWLAYARSDGQLRGNTLALTRQLGGDTGTRVTTRDLERLNHAGFIRFSASKPLALRYQVASPEVEVEREKEKNNPVTVTALHEDRNGSGHGEIDPDEINRLLAEAAVKDMTA